MKKRIYTGYNAYSFVNLHGVRISHLTYNSANRQTCICQLTSPLKSAKFYPSEQEVQKMSRSFFAYAYGFYYYFFRKSNKRLCCD